MTYTGSYNISMTKDITKNDIITLCELLNNRELFHGICTFEPEPISEGGIIFRYIHPTSDKWYKCIRIEMIDQYERWPFINKDVMKEWKDNNDLLFNAGSVQGTFLKSSGGAPSFTLEELNSIESCLSSTI